MLVVRGAGDDPLLRSAFPLPYQVARRLQLVQRLRDPVLRLHEPVGERPDADGGAVGHGLDPYGVAEGGGGDPRVEGEVIADDRELGVVAVPYVEHTGG
ncbi:hypothetical protein A6A06_32920 [Streptomyces sp. CB02923]|nr:hypothetical protein A6A06_32920 [Streptomyces sp. CB02923]